MTDAEIQAALPKSYADLHARLTAEAERIERDKAIFDAQKERYRDIKGNLALLEATAHDARHGEDVSDNPMLVMVLEAALSAPKPSSTSRTH